MVADSPQWLPANCPTAAAGSSPSQGAYTHCGYAKSRFSRRSTCSGIGKLANCAGCRPHQFHCAHPHSTVARGDRPLPATPSQEAVVYGNWKPEHPERPEKVDTKIDSEPQPKERVYGRLEAMLMGLPADGKNSTSNVNFLLI